MLIVVEGWEILKLKDQVIDKLLNSPNVGLLKRYRNGVFHFQKKYNNEKFINFMQEGLDTIKRIRALNSAFSQFFIRSLS